MSMTVIIGHFNWSCYLLTYLLNTYLTVARITSLNYFLKLKILVLAVQNNTVIGEFQPKTASKCRKCA